MASFDVVIDTSVFERRLTQLEREQLPFARVLASNTAAFETLQTMRKSLPIFFDRPTPWTVARVMQYAKATKEHPAATIFIPADPDKGAAPTDVLGHHIFGTQRPAKRSEKQLQRAGLMSRDEILVPASGMELDQYGNVRGRTMVQILSQLRAFTESGFQANVTARSQRRRRRRPQDHYFWSRGGALKRGVWKRQGVTYKARYKRGSHAAGRMILPRGVIPVLLVAKSPVYPKRFDFPELAGNEARRRFLAAWPAALRRAVRTARRR